MIETLILMHTKCYVTISLADIAKGVKLESVEIAEKHILRMIEEGKLCAKINLQDGNTIVLIYQQYLQKLITNSSYLFRNGSF